jgi:UDP-N-acetylmuramoylalanine--D-glutamate ligase
MVLKNKKVLIVGLGKTGVAAARFLKQKGALVTATDIRPDAEIAEAGELRSLGINIEAGGHRVESFLDTDLIVVSPGVPPDIEPLQRAGDKGISIISEVELACDEIKEPIVGITGTNGKTTTTALIGEVFSKAGIDVFVGGNIGRPLIGYSGGARYVVAELPVSSWRGYRNSGPLSR